MKIGVDVAPLLQSKTGVGWYTDKIIRNIKDDEIELIAQTFRIFHLEEAKEMFKGTNIAVDNVFLPIRLYKRIWSILPYQFLFKNKVDIYHFFGFVVPQKIKGKVIVTIYDMVYKKFPETMEKKNQKYLEKNVKRSAERADIILTISENAKREIIEYLNIDEKKIKIVYPGVDLEDYDKEFKEDICIAVKEKYNLPEKYFLYLGTLEPRKNITTIIKSYAKYKEKYGSHIKLVIAGKKGWEYNNIFNEVTESNLTQDVVFTDYVDEKDKPYIYAMSEIFIFPSLYEGFGIPVLEAMAARVPVITSNVSSLPEVVGDAAILVSPMDSDAIFKGMEKIIKNVELKNKMIQKGLLQTKKFNWALAGKQMEEIYKELEKK